MSTSSRNEAKPKVSIIIPTYNRAEVLRECLAALALQDFPFGSFEIIVIDDGSTDNTAEVVQQATSRFETHYIFQKNSGPAAARNCGVRHAEGDLILIINDDAIAPSSLVAGHYLMHRKVQCGGRLAILGTREFRVEDKTRTLNFLYDQVPFSMRVYGWSEGFYPSPFFVTFNISMRRCDFEEVGGFDEDFTSAIGEDTEFGARWASSQGKILFLPQLRAHHFHDVTVDGLKNQIIRETFNKLILVNKQPDAWKPLKIFREPESVMLEYLGKMGPPMLKFESGLKETECLSIWEVEGRQFMGARVECITDFVMAVRKLYPHFHTHVALRSYLDDPRSREMVERWDLPENEGFERRKESWPQNSVTSGLLF